MRISGKRAVSATANTRHLPAAVHEQPTAAGYSAFEDNTYEDSA
jgi:hypothetical protein